LASSSLSDAKAAIEVGQYQRAVESLSSLTEREPSNPDVFNLLGYALRQLGRLDESLSQYQKALSLDPEHRGANEYLGELYLKQGRVDLAKARLEVLDRVCFFPCKEYEDLKLSIEQYQAVKK
ncbi:MAG: tetratricopeptide repeat protein, partial [Chromatiales bacterium]|nr:tetratricopeptide repeat protein [Chromatiales bacterium]